MLKRANEIAKQMVEWRREFHQHPELGFHEHRTASRVVEILQPLGYRLRSGVGRTGVVAELGQGHPIVGVRADMDALPLQEANAVPYASQNSGVMHACGHDVHTAIALGVATLLFQERFPGTVRFLFQPSEEVDDEGGKSGAPRMVEDGAMEGVDRVIALHVDAATPVGDIGVHPGPSSAGCDTLHATIIGRGGHGAAPEETIDPIHVGAHVILALHGIVSRRIRPADAAVISLCSVRSGYTDNVIPERFEVNGTIRYTEMQVRKQLHEEIERAMQVARALGADYELQLVPGGPPMQNDEGVVQTLQQIVTDLLGEGHLMPPKLDMGAEDFGVFTSLAPGAMFGLGARIEGSERVAHSPLFDVDERCMPIGCAIMAEAALRLLKQ